MALHMTPELMEAAYDRLRMTPPFKGWNLPSPDDLAFHVKDYKDRFGHFQDMDGTGWKNITVSSRHVRSLYTLDEVMAHEMCHVREWQLLGNRFKGDHGPRFRRLADQVCRHHGFDRSRF